MSKWKILTALILLPVLVAGGFLWGTWNASDRLHKVEAAVVNLDEAVTIDGQIIPLGRQLSANLVDGERAENFTWVLADEAHAYPGLTSGRYAAVVVIPKNFSAMATSYAEDAADAGQATIEVRTSPVAGLADGTLGTVIADAAAKTLNETLTTAYLDRIYLGFNDMGEQFETVADGAGKLADGAEELADGVGQAQDGAGQLTDGMGELAANSGSLTSGAGQLSSGSAKLTGGLSSLESGAATLPADTKALAAGVKQYVGGVDQLIDQTRASMGQLPQLIAGVDQLSTGATQLSGGIAQFRQGMAGISSDPTSAGVPCPSGYSAEQCQAFFAGLATGTGIAAQQVAPLATGASDLADGLATLNTQVSAMKPDPDAAAQLDALQAGGAELVSGTAALADGMPELVDGIEKLQDGSAKLTSGLKEFADGLGRYTDGVDQAASGSTELSDGLGQLADGAEQLSDGSRTLADGLATGATKVPSYTKGERESLAAAVSSPIRTTNLDALVSPTTALASLLLVLSLWLGALATYAVIAAIGPGMALSTKSSAALLWEALTPGVIVAAAQALALAVLGSVLLGLPAGKVVVVTAFLLLAGAAFVAVNHALAAWLGVAGRLLGVALAVMGAASAVTTAVPEFFDAVRPFSPVTPALDGLRALLTDSSGAASASYGLVGWLLVAVLASAAAVLRKRTVSASELAALG